MELGLGGKRVLVAAASQGIGKAIAMGFQREGAQVAICARDKAKLEAARDEIQLLGKMPVLAIGADVGSEQQLTALVDRLQSEWGGVDVLINNAGGPPAGRHDSVEDKQWQAAFDLTVRSAVRLTNLVLPGMKQQRWGRVINISSYSVKQPLDGMMLSNSLRLSVLGWAKTLANEVAAQGVLVNTICPGWTETDRALRLLDSKASAQECSVEALTETITETIPLGRFGQPEEIANLAVFLASQAASYITGCAIAADGGATQAL